MKSNELGDPACVLVDKALQKLARPVVVDIAFIIDQTLRELDVHFWLPERGDEGHSWHVFTPLLPLRELTISRAQFMEAMKAHGIGVGVHYPAIHLFSAYRALGFRPGQFPHAERIGRETVTLPLFPAMELRDVDRVVAAANTVLAEARK